MKTLTLPTRRLGCALLVLSALTAAGPGNADDGQSVLAPLKTITTIHSTVPPNGDVNPYGMAQIKHSTGKLVTGHILISNFNDAGNFQGTGTTIVDVGPDGSFSVFAAIDASALPPGSCPGGVGLTTALVVLDEGWVIVGSLPTNAGMFVEPGSGCLLVLNSGGKVVETFFGSLINGPWDMTAFEREHEAKLFVTNVLNGTVAAGGSVVHRGTVTRLDLKLSASASAMPVLESITVIGSGFPERTDPSALVIGPTGVAVRASCGSDNCEDRQGDDEGEDGALLYVADTLSNRIAVIDHPLGRTSTAGIGRTLSEDGSLNGPLGLVITPGGHLLTVNSGDGFITEISPRGTQLAKFQLDKSGSPPGAGALFGLAFDPTRGVFFVDDADNTMKLLHH
jgi:DNA-binding beta-propeller fold protein YncE